MRKNIFGDKFYYLVILQYLFIYIYIYLFCRSAFAHALIAALNVITFAFPFPIEASIEKQSLWQIRSDQG